MSSLQPEEEILLKKLKSETPTPTLPSPTLPSLKKRDGYPRSLHLMLDLETKAKTPRSMIMQIGAIVFTPNEDGSGFKKCVFDTFFLNIEDVRESDVYDIDPETISWWEEKDKKDAWKRYIESEDKVPIKEALEKFSDFVTDYRISKLWAKPSRFDFSIIEYAFNKEGVKIPWFHGNVNCLRSVISINESKFIKDKRSYFEERRVQVKDILNDRNIDLLEHNPVYDCILQIYDLLFFYQKFEEERVPKQNLESFVLNSYFQVREKETSTSSSPSKPLDEGRVKVRGNVNENGFHVSSSSSKVGKKKKFVLTIEPLDEDEGEGEVGTGTGTGAESERKEERLDK